MSGSAPLLEVSHLTKHYPVRSGVFGRTQAEVHAVDDVRNDRRIPRNRGNKCQ